MRSTVFTVALAFGAVALPALAPAIVSAKGDDKANTEQANTDFTAITDWLKEQSPKTADDRKKLRAELTSKLKAFLKSYPSAGHVSIEARATLADVYVQDKNFDAALPLFEDLGKSNDEKYGTWGKLQVVRTLIEKKDYPQARTRLDALKKEVTTGEENLANLAKLDEALKQREGMSAAAASLKIGGVPPALKSKAFDGSDVSLEALKGKVVLVDFWATWCPPCRAELPNLKKVYAGFHAKGFEVVGVDGVERDSAKLKDFLAKEQIAWPQLVEDGKKISREWGVLGLPRLVLLDKDGKVAALDLTGDRLAKAVAALVEGKPIPPEVLAPAADGDKGKNDAGKKEEGKDEEADGK